MSFIDDIVGRIMEVLTRRRLWENTLILYTSDHGEMLGDFGRFGKGNFTEQVIRALYFLVPPSSRDREDGPHLADSLVEHVDLAPTILDYTGVPHPAELPA